MLALRLTRIAHPAVHARRFAVTAAATGTGFLLLSTLGHALTHPDSTATSALRLAWCTIPLAATAYFAMSVARTDPSTRPRPGLSAIGLGPGKRMAISATTTALSTLLGSALALLVFLHLRGDLTGVPFKGAADFLAAGRDLPLPAALTLLAVVPVTASGAVAMTLRPRDARPKKRGARSLGGFGRGRGRETFGSYGRFGARAHGTEAKQPAAHRADTEPTEPTQPADTHAAEAGAQPTQPAGNRAARAARVGAGGTPQARASVTPHSSTPSDPHQTTNPQPATRPSPTALPWGTATLAAGLAIESYAARTTPTTTPLTLPAGLPTGPAAILLGWTLTAVGLALAGPGLTHFCGRLLQTLRPGALRLLAGRGLMEESARIGRPLGILCAVTSGVYAMTALGGDKTSGPLSTLGALLVTGCTLGTLLMAAVEARQSRADTTAALIRLGAPTTTLRTAAALRGAALAAVFTPLTLLVAELATLPLTDR